MGKLYKALCICSVIFIFEGRIFMNQNDFEKEKKSNKQLESDIGIGSVSNAAMTSMYNMSNMTSGPSDATEEEKAQLNARSAASKGTIKG